MISDHYRLGRLDAQILLAKRAEAFRRQHLAFLISERFEQAAILLDKALLLDELIDEIGEQKLTTFHMIHRPLTRVTSCYSVTCTRGRARKYLIHI